MITKLHILIYFLLLFTQGTCKQVTHTNNNYVKDEKEDVGKIFVEAINSTSMAIQKELIPKIFSSSLIDDQGIDKLISLLQKFHEQFSPLDYHHSEINRFVKPDGDVYVMHIYARKKGDVMFRDFQLYVDPLPLQKINKVAFIAEVAEPVNLPNGSIQQKETQDWLANYLEKLKKENDLSGSILIAEGDHVLFEEVFGYADIAKKNKINKTTLFNIASGGKMFTALAIAKLVETGKIKYDEKITKYLGGFTEKTKADKITIHHLLSHTSGVNEYWSGQTNSAVYTATCTNDHLKIVYQVGLGSEPGTEYTYCNSNFILLGAIIEKVSGQSFFDFVHTQIFKQAGMMTTGYFEHGSPNTAIPLARGEKEYTWVEAKHGIKGSPAGGTYSNAYDLLKFSQALKKNLIVSGQTFKDMVTVKNKGLNVTEDYGYGFILQKQAMEYTYGHGGTTGGVNFEFRYFPNQDITLVVFSNQNNGAYDDLKRNAVKLIAGQR